VTKFIMAVYISVFVAKDGFYLEGDFFCRFGAGDPDEDLLRLRFPGEADSEGDRFLGEWGETDLLLGGERDLLGERDLRGERERRGERDLRGDLDLRGGDLRGGERERLYGGDLRRGGGRPPLPLPPRPRHGGPLPRLGGDCLQGCGLIGRGGIVNCT